MKDGTNTQVTNGKAFEYALATQYVRYLTEHDVITEMAENDAFKIASKCYFSCEEEERKRFDAAAYQTIDTIIKLEPGLTAQKGKDDVLEVLMMTDAAGQGGDVRDVVFKRSNPAWEIGFSAKNNHEAAKHSRLSDDKDFGESWLGVKCSQQYWDEVLPVFGKLRALKDQKVKWNELDNKHDDYYVPVLKAFRDEMCRINAANDNIPQLLIKYLIGKHPFYKIIKDDKHKLVVVKAFHVSGELNKSYNGVKPRYCTPKLKFPSRIVEFDFKKNSKTTLHMILDEGWEISFRIHSGDGPAIPSLKFDITLIGNPPILFTQHLFQ